MSVRAIEFETLKELCKHSKEEESDVCLEEDNYSSVCECAECPIWNDLKNSEVEL